MWEFQCLPFGLTSAPRVFTKLMKPVMAVLRKQGIRCVHDLYRRCSSAVPVKGGASEDHLRVCPPATESGVSGQLGEIGPDPMPVYHLPRISSELCDVDTESFTRQAGGSYSELHLDHKDGDSGVAPIITGPAEGSSLIADWQTLGKDFCRIFSPFHYHNNSSILCEHYKSPTLHSYCVEMQMAAEISNWTLQASELCQATQGCHWNQFSVISNSLCTNNCPAICRNVHQSLNIIQYSVGAALFVFAIPIYYSLLISNNLHRHEQVQTMSIHFGSCTVAITSKLFYCT